MSPQKLLADMREQKTKQEDVKMARICASLIFAAVGAVILSIAHGQVAAGNFQHIGTERHLMMACVYVSIVLMLPDLLRPIGKMLRRIFRRQ